MSATEVTNELSPQQLAAIFKDRPFTEAEMAHIEALIETIGARKPKTQDDHFWLLRLKSYLPKPAGAKTHTDKRDTQTVSTQAKAVVTSGPVKGDSVTDISTKDQLVIKQLNERLYHQNINPIEEAKAIKKAIDKLRISQKVLAPLINKSERHISDALALLLMPRPLQAMVASGEVKPTSKIMKDALITVRNGDKINSKAVISKSLPQSVPSAPMVPIQRDVAIALSQLIVKLSKNHTALAPIDMIITPESATRDLQAVLHQNALLVLEAI